MTTNIPELIERLRKGELLSPSRQVSAFEGRPVYSGETRRIAHPGGLEAATALSHLHAEVERYRDALEAIANHGPGVTHGWAEHVRSMARKALEAGNE